MKALWGAEGSSLQQNRLQLYLLATLAQSLLSYSITHIEGIFQTLYNLNDCNLNSTKNKSLVANGDTGSLGFQVIPGDNFGALFRFQEADAIEEMHPLATHNCQWPTNKQDFALYQNPLSMLGCAMLFGLWVSWSTGTWGLIYWWKDREQLKERNELRHFKVLTKNNKFIKMP